MESVDDCQEDGWAEVTQDFDPKLPADRSSLSGYVLFTSTAVGEITSCKQMNTS